MPKDKIADINRDWFLNWNENQLNLMVTVYGSDEIERFKLKFKIKRDVLQRG